MIHGTIQVINGREVTVDDAVYILPRNNGVILKREGDSDVKLMMSELKVGMTVALHGPPKAALHTIRVEADAPDEAPPVPLPARSTPRHSKTEASHGEEVRSVPDPGKQAHRGRGRS